MALIGSCEVIWMYRMDGIDASPKRAAPRFWAELVILRRRRRLNLTRVYSIVRVARTRCVRLPFDPWAKRVFRQVPGTGARRWSQSISMPGSRAAPRNNRAQVIVG